MASPQEQSKDFVFKDPRMQAFIEGSQGGNNRGKLVDLMKRLRKTAGQDPEGTRNKSPILSKGVSPVLINFESPKNRKEAQKIVDTLTAKAEGLGVLRRFEFEKVLWRRELQILEEAELVLAHVDRSLVDKLLSREQQPKN